MTDALRKLVTSIAAKTIQDGGTTYSFAKKEFVNDADKWFYPKYPALTRVVPVDDLTQALSDYIDRHAELLEQESMYLGTWINPESKKCHLDVNTASASKDGALLAAHRAEEGQEGEILAVYNPHRDESASLEE